MRYYYLVPLIIRLLRVNLSRRLSQAVSTCMSRAAAARCLHRSPSVPVWEARPTGSRLVEWPVHRGSSPRPALGPFQLGPTGVALALALALALAVKADALPMLLDVGERRQLIALPLGGQRNTGHLEKASRPHITSSSMITDHVDIQDSFRPQPS